MKNKSWNTPLWVKHLKLGKTQLSYQTVNLVPAPTNQP